MTAASLLRHVDRDDRRRARVRGGSLLARKPAARDWRLSTWTSTSGRQYAAAPKDPGAAIPEGSIVLAVRRDARGACTNLMVEAYEGDRAGFAPFPRLALMLGATELQICGQGGAAGDRLLVARDLAGVARIDRAALLARPLTAGGVPDRGAVMATACAVARARRDITGEAWGACLSAALKGTWALARSAGPAAAR